MRPLMMWGLVVLCASGSFAAPPDLSPLVRFRNNVSENYSYAHTFAELDAWRKVDTVTEEGPIGLVATTQLPGTVRLYRASRETNQRHFYFTQKTNLHNGVTLDNVNFKVYVWTQPGDGRVPVYSSVGARGDDVLFDHDVEIIRQADDNAKAKNELRSSSVNDPVFYVYPVSPIIAPAPAVVESANASSPIVDLAKMKIAGRREDAGSPDALAPDNRVPPPGPSRVFRRFDRTL